MKLIVITQYRENYGYRWKNKGGDTFVTQVESSGNLTTLSENLAALAAEVTKEVEYANDMTTNEVISWYVMGDNEPYSEDFYDVTILEKVDGKWTRRRELVADPINA